MRAATASASVAANTGKISDLMTRINIAVGGELVRGFMSAANGADELAGRAQSVLDRLYPNEAREREYAADLAALKARYGESAENAGRLADAQQRLKNEWIASLPAVDSISAGLSKYTRNAEAAAAKSEVVNVRVTKSFEDMASESLSALNQLANGVRNGGFLDILTSVLNIGLQLGQAGAFGKSAQSFLNQPIGANANGTSWWRGGLSVVGERGPELVNLPRGASVTPNNKLGSLGGGIAEIRPSPYFDVVVDGRVMRAAPSIAQAGAAGGVARVQRSGTRRVA